VFILYVLPQIVVFIIASAIASTLYVSIFHHEQQDLPFIFFGILILLEGIRIFFRRFLHNVFFNKSTVLIEHAFSVIYYLAVWLPFAFGSILTAKLVFTPYLITSLCVVSIFIYMIFTFYKMLPDIDLSSQDNTDFYGYKNLWWRIIKNRYYNSMINIEKFVISGNFLVPFFAITFGLHHAGLFRIASTVARSIRALVKSVVHFPGGAFLSSLKTKSDELKKEAFYILAIKINSIIVFTTTLLIISYNLFYSIPLGLHKTSFLSTSAKEIWLYLFIFAGITILHQFFVAYEQFYIIEECANRLFLIKSIEFILFYFLIWKNSYITPVIILANIVLIQLFCFSLIAIHAYSKWKIKPCFKIQLGPLAISLIGIAIFLSVIKYFI
jgi:hypothetical protein